MIFFDLDGTLCQPHPNYQKIFSAALHEVFEGEGLDYSTLYQAWLRALSEEGAMTTRTALKTTLKICGVSSFYPLDEITKKLNEAYISGLSLYPETLNLLEILKNRGYRIGIITNGPYDTQLGVIRRLHLDRYVDHIFISGDHKIGVRKPNPEIFHYALATTQALPHDSVMVGDCVEKDLLPAKELGLATFLVHGDDPSVISFPDLKSMGDYFQLMICRRT